MKIAVLSVQPHIHFFSSTRSQTPIEVPSRSCVDIV